MSLFSYELEKHGARVLPAGKAEPSKYRVVCKRETHKPGHVEIEIWNKHVNHKRPLVCVCLDENGEETYSNVSGFYPFNVSSDKIFAHYRELERLLKKAKKQHKRTKI